MHVISSLDELSKDTQTGIEELKTSLEKSRKTLFEYRKKRVHPFKDKKILTDWNGLMIAALAKGSVILNEPALAGEAATAANFILTALRKDGTLLHRFKDGEAVITGNLDDYAFMTWGLLELYEATFDPEFLKHAMELTDKQIENFWDEENGGFFFTSESGEELLVRTKELYDGAVPSGNSVSFMNLLRLSKLTANTKYENLAAKLSKAFAGKVKDAPVAYSQFLSAQTFAFGPSYEIVIAAKNRDDKLQAVLEQLNGMFIPNKVVLVITEKDKDAVTELAPFTKEYTATGDLPAIYVCKNYVCSLPTTDVNEMKKLLGK